MPSGRGLQVPVIYDIVIPCARPANASELRALVGDGQWSNGAKMNFQIEMGAADTHSDTGASITSDRDGVAQRRTAGEAGEPGARSAVTEAAMKGYSVELVEHHFHSPGYMEQAVGPEIVIAVNEPGSYAFDMNLWAHKEARPFGATRTPPAERVTETTADSGRTLIATAHTMVTLVQPSAARVPPAVPYAFEHGFNVYSHEAKAIMHTRMRTHSDASAAEAARRDTQAARDAIYRPTLVGSRQPRHVRRRLSPLRPLRVALLGSVGPYFDGTKQFLVQHETTSDRRLVEFTHIDMAEPATTGETRLMAQMLRNASIPLLFRQITLFFSEFDGIKDFLEAGTRLARFQGWCDAPRRMRDTLKNFANELVQHDVLWHVNHDHMEDYFPQTARLVKPSMLRVWDLVGHVSTPCRHSRLDALHRALSDSDALSPGTQASVRTGGNLIDLSAVPTTAAVASICPARDDMQDSRLPLEVLPTTWIRDSHEGTYMHAQYAQHLDAAWAHAQKLAHDGVSVHEAMHRARQLLDRRFAAELDDPAADVASWRNARQRWQLKPHDLAMTPAHFIARHAHVRSYAMQTAVVPGLHRDVPGLRLHHEVEADSQHARVCSELLNGGSKSLLWGLSNTAGNGSAPRHPLTVAFIGRLSREKGAALFVEAVATVLGRLQIPGEPPPQFLIVGGAASGYDEPLRSLAAELGVAGAIQFLGFIPPVRLEALYRERCLDVVVAPYLRPLSETFGLVITEAMTAEVPVIVFNVGGMQDYVRPGYNAMVPSSMSAAALGDSILELVNNGTLRRMIGQQARAFIDERISKMTLADFSQRLLRREHVDRMLVYGHIPAGLDHVRAVSSADDDACAQASTGPLNHQVLYDLVREASSGAARGPVGCENLEFPTVRSGAKHALYIAVDMRQTAFNGSAQLFATLRMGLRIIDAELQHPMDDNELAVAIADDVVPGFGDVLCGGVQNSGSDGCQPRDVHHFLAESIASTLLRTVQLCLVRNGTRYVHQANSLLDAATACYYMMDLSSNALGIIDSDAAWLKFRQSLQRPHHSVPQLPLLQMQMSLPNNFLANDERVAVALTDARVPYMLLAAASCKL